MDALASRCSVYRGYVRVLLDANAFDVLARDDETVDRVREAVAAGRLSLFAIPAQLEEIRAIRDAQKQERLLRLPVEPMPPVFRIGVSRLGEAVLGSEASQAIDEAIATSPTHTADSDAAVRAEVAGVPLVTRDTRLIRRAREHSIAILDPAALLALLGIATDQGEEPHDSDGGRSAVSHSQPDDAR